MYTSVEELNLFIGVTWKYKISLWANSLAHPASGELSIVEVPLKEQSAICTLQIPHFHFFYWFYLPFTINVTLVYYQLTTYVPRSNTLDWWCLHSCFTCLAPAMSCIRPLTDMGKVSAPWALDKTMVTAFLNIRLIRCDSLIWTYIVNAGLRVASWKCE